MKIHPAFPDCGFGLFNAVRHKSLFGGNQQKPVVLPPAVMPTPDDAAVQAAKKRKMAAAQQQSGRQSTILTDYGNTQTDRLGG